MYIKFNFDTQYMIFKLILKYIKKIIVIRLLKSKNNQKIMHEL
jgi:hypothetical protein